MNTNHLIESIFDRVLDEKRNNTPVPTDEADLLSQIIDENDVELSAVEDNKYVVNNECCEPSNHIDPMFDPILDIEPKIAEKEEMLRHGNVADKEKKSKYAILCASLSKLLCRN